MAATSRASRPIINRRHFTNSGRYSAGNGAMTMGSDVEMAMLRMELIEHAAIVQRDAAVLGEAVALGLFGGLVGVGLSALMIKAVGGFLEENMSAFTERRISSSAPIGSSS